jgi:hypothetical protein
MNKKIVLLYSKETNVSTVHFLGAAMAFLGLYIYLILQTYLSYKHSFVLHSTKNIFLFRMVI